MRRPKPRPYEELNVTPLMDLAWTLLVVFIIIATATVQGIQVDLPKASKAPSLAEPKTKAITVAADGRIYLNTAQVTLSELRSRLRLYRAEDPELPVIVKGDAVVPYERVVQVLDLVKQLEIYDVGLVTQQIVK